MPMDAYGIYWIPKNIPAFSYILMLRRIQSFRIWTRVNQEDSSDPEIIEFVSQAGLIDVL